MLWLYINPLAINGIARYTNTLKPYRYVYGRAMVYISDTRVKNVNSISKYTTVKCLSLDDAWRKGPAMIVNSSFICVKC